MHTRILFFVIGLFSYTAVAGVGEISSENPMIEAVLGYSVKPEGITFTVSNHGCASKENFKLEVTQEKVEISRKDVYSPGVNLAHKGFGYVTHVKLMRIAPSCYAASRPLELFYSAEEIAKDLEYSAYLLTIDNLIDF